MESQGKLIKFMQKIIVTLGLLCIFLISCLGIVMILFTAAWLHTYNAFTDKELVAEITVKPLEKDERGLEQFEVTYTQYKGQSALLETISPSNENNKDIKYSESFKMYGDHVFVEAHIVKLPDATTLLNFDAIYKITGIEGDFINDREKAKQLDGSERSIYNLNGGVDSTWKWIKGNESNLRFIIDTTLVTKQGKEIDDEMKWGIYITEEGMIIDTIE